MKSKQRGFTLTELLIAIIWLVVVVGGGIGWVLNIIDIAHTYHIFTGMLILRIVGIFVPPLGAVLGYL